jgi:hypothetical protein
MRVSDVTAAQNLLNQSIRTITPLALLRVTGICDNLTIEAITQFQRRVVRLPAADGRVDPGGQTLQALVTTASGGTFHPGLGPVAGVPAAPAHAPNTPYTDSPNEVVTKNTVPTPKDVIAMLRSGWSELNEQGARTLTVQFLHETGGAKYCFNWNLGNIKAKSANVLHMYLRNTWEGFSAHGAKVSVANSDGLAHIPTAEEVKAKGWRIPGKTVVVFQPSHPWARFRAFPSLAEGAKGWMNHHKLVGATYSGYVAAATAGKCALNAHFLKVDHYYTGDEGAYSVSMTSKKAELDRTLGPAV